MDDILKGRASSRPNTGRAGLEIGIMCVSETEVMYMKMEHSLLCTVCRKSDSHGP